MTGRHGARRILVITAHPDDADVHAGGTLARWVDEGHHVHSVVLTSGDKGHADPAIGRDEVTRLRRAEQEAAARILGVHRVSFLDYEDGELAWIGPRLAEEVSRLIREARPDVIVKRLRPEYGYRLVERTRGLQQAAAS